MQARSESTLEGQEWARALATPRRGRGWFGSSARRKPKNSFRSAARTSHDTQKRRRVSGNAGNQAQPGAKRDRLQDRARVARVGPQQCNTARQRTAGCLLHRCRAGVRSDSLQRVAGVGHSGWSAKYIVSRAIATVAEVDVVVSWNFRHIVRLDKLRLFNGVNLELGYKPLTIYSPREVATYGQEY